VLLARGDDKTGRRDIWVVPDTGERGGKAVNLTNTPDFDEFDAVWSHDGRRIAFASDRPAAGAGKAGDLNIWVMETDRPEKAPAFVKSLVPLRILRTSKSTSLSISAPIRSTTASM